MKIVITDFEQDHQTNSNLVSPISDRVDRVYCCDGLFLECVLLRSCGVVSVRRGYDCTIGHGLLRLCDLTKISTLTSCQSTNLANRRSDPLLELGACPSL